MAETRLAQAALLRDWVKALIGKFALWIHNNRQDAPNLLAVFRRHGVFFEKIDAQYSDLEDLTAEGLLALFGTAGLRKHMLPCAFLAEAINLRIAASLRGDFAEEGRLAEKLRSARKQPWGKLLNDFALELKKKEVSLRTMRLYVSAAEVLCATIPPATNGWSHEQLQKFLRKKPGLRANISIFVNYCRRAHGLTASMPRASPRKSARTPAIVRELRVLIQETREQGMDNVSVSTLARIIAKSLGLPLKKITEAVPRQFIESQSGLLLEVDGESISVPARLEPYAKCYLVRLVSQMSPGAAS